MGASSAVEWRLVVDGDEIAELYDVRVVDTANPFGDFAVLKMDDAGGQLFDRFGRGTRVEVDISTNAGVSYVTRFTGFVVERRELEQAGADKLEVEAYSFDQFLRRNTVTNDQSGKTIAAALQDIVTTDTPVSFVSGNVTVGNPQTVTESLRGRKVEQVLQGLAFASTGEEFGVNDNLEFFFRPPETRHIERGIDNTQWFNFDIPELGKDAINEVEVFFDGGSESVVVDRGKSKLDVQNELGLPQPATERKELNRDDIDTFVGAKQAGEQFLRFRNTVLTGTITTFDLFDAEPGDTIDVTVNPRGIDDEFRIAEVEYRWGRDETVITIVEKRSQDQSTDILRVSEKVDRIEQRGADRDGVQNRVTNTDVAAAIGLTGVLRLNSGDVFADQSRLTNAGRNLIRDEFTGESTPDIAAVAVGSDASNLSRSNTALENEVARDTSVQSAVASPATASVSGSFTNVTVQEIGVFAGQTLVCRFTFDEPVGPADPLVEVDFDVGNDASVDRGVITETGRKMVRDIIAPNQSPALPTEYVYGRGQSTPTETDTTLDDRAVALSVGEVSVQTADTTSEFDAITDISATDPFVVANGEIALSQTAFTTEWENSNFGGSTGPTIIGRPQFSGNGPTDGNGEGAQYNANNQLASISFTPDHTIPSDEFELWIRIEAEDGPALKAILDGDEWQIFPRGGSVSPRASTQPIWGNVTGPDFKSEQFPGGDIAGGESHTLTIESITSGGNNSTDPRVDIDLVVPVDSVRRFTGASDASGAHFFDATVVDGPDGGRYLDGPQLFPSEIPLSLADETTRRIATALTFNSSWTDVSNNQFIEVSIDGTNFVRRNNTQTDTVTFADGGTAPAANLGFSRFGTRDTATPRLGFNGQAIQSWELIADTEGITPSDIGAANVRAIAPTGDLSAESDNLTEGGQRDANGNLLSRSIFPAFPIGSQTRVESSEETTFTEE